MWLTGYTTKQIDEQIMKEVDYKTFFEEAPEMNPNCNLITGNICGIKIQEIEDPFYCYGCCGYKRKNLLRLIQIRRNS